MQAVGFRRHFSRPDHRQGREIGIAWWAGKGAFHPNCDSGRQKELSGPTCSVLISWHRNIACRRSKTGAADGDDTGARGRVGLRARHPILNIGRQRSLPVKS